nr:hypothetical protein GCM10025732_36150 [Glycomyces mayteni]
MDHAERLAAGVEVQAHGERQPGAAAAAGLAVGAVDADHRAQRAVLLDAHLVDVAGVAVAGDRAGLGARGLGLGDVHQVAFGGDGAVAALDVLDEVGAGLADADLHDAGVHVDVVARLGDRHGVLGLGGLARFEGERLLDGGRADGVGGPLQGAVGPVGEGPGLERHGRAVGAGELEPLVRGEAAGAPRDAPGGAGGLGGGAFEPVEPHRIRAGVGGRAGLGVRGSGLEERGRRRDPRGGGEDAAAAEPGAGQRFGCGFGGGGRAGHVASKGERTGPDLNRFNLGGSI